MFNGLEDLFSSIIQQALFKFDGTQITFINDVGFEVFVESGEDGEAGEY